MTEQSLLSTQEAAEFLQVSRALLEKWRCYGGGPDYVKIGKSVRYTRSSLDEFIFHRTIPGAVHPSGPKQASNN